MNKLLAALLLTLSLVGCSGYDRGVREPAQTVPVACKRQEVYCYLTNFSSGDTLLVAPAKLMVDDSLIVAEEVPRNPTGNERFSTLIRLCEGTHRVHVQFGPYTRDTTFAVSQDIPISLLATILCRDVPALAHEDGLSIVTLIRDGKGGPD
jgi:hypothetical protein